MAELMDRKRLIEYLPRFVQNFSELEELFRAVNVETDLIYSQIGKMLDEAYIDDCTEYGIKKYESICGILPAASDTLEERKARVKIRWNDSIPYTFIALIRKLNLYCGVNNYDIDADLENYYISISIHSIYQSLIQEIEKMIDRMMPANMYCGSNSCIDHKLDTVLYCAGAIITAKHLVIQTDLDQDYTLDTDYNDQSYMITHKTTEITTETETATNISLTEYQTSNLITHKQIIIE